MKYTIIACKVLYREISYIASQSKNITDVIYLPQGLHNTPEILKSTLKDEVLKVKDCDAVLLGYGLCSGGIAGLEAGNIPIVVPKTDDCIGILLGSQKRYLEYFNRLKGAYWYNPGWIETAFVPSRENYEKKLKEYTEMYGEENAEFLLNEENTWIKNYTTCAYISSPILEDIAYENYTRECAADFSWDFVKIEGDMRMVKNLIDGEFNETDFLICSPGYKIIESFDDGKIKATKIE